jgi:HNH endonuclease
VGRARVPIPDAVRSDIRKRAANRCEYCKRDIGNDTFHLDHIDPHGSDEVSNLALSCHRCNLNKSDHLNWVDPHTGASNRLFDPVIDDWNRHFNISGGSVHGKSGIGRSTAALLFRFTPQFIAVDRIWWPLQSLERNRPAYSHLNQLAFYRSQNRHSLLQKELTNPLKDLELAPNDRMRAEFAVAIIRSELFYTRAKTLDIRYGLAHAKRSLRRFREIPASSVFHEHLSYFYRERATRHLVSRNMRLAERDHSLSEKNFRIFLESPVASSENWRYLESFFSEATIETSHIRTQGSVRSNVPIDEYLAYINDSDPTSAVHHNKRLMDYLIFDSRSKTSMMEELYDWAESVLSTEGYAVSGDLHHLANVRSRWWAVRFMLDKEPNLDLFAADLTLWSRLGLHNDIRELYTAIDANELRMPRKLGRDSLELINRICKEI